MAHLQYMPGDPRLVDQLVYELKSKGIFDQFRKECISDVDTRPAYQNLRQRVENSVATFLSRQCWKPDLNKNQLREKLRKHILDGNYLEQGVERIVDQVVNPKVATVFIPQVEDLVYNYLGITRKKAPETTEPDLLPTDLEAVSPGSVKSDKHEEEDMVVDEPTESSEDKEDKMDVETESTDIQITETVISEDSSMDKSSIPLPAEEIKLENIPAPENSPPKVTEVELDRIALPREQNPSTDIPLPEESVKIEKGQYFRPLTLHSDESNTSSDSSLRRNMSPLTPIRNFNNENSCDAQQGFDDSDAKSNDKTPSSFRFAIETDVKSDNKSDKKDDLSYQFNNQVNINYNTPMYDDSSNSNNLQIDYESDVSKNTEIKAEETSQDKKEKKDDKKSHKSSHRSRDSSRHSKDRKSDSKSSRDSRSDRKTSSKDDKHKSKERERSKDRKGSRDSSKNRSHKSSSKDSKSHRSSSSSHRKDDKKSSRDKDSRSSKDKSRDKSSSKDKDRKSSKDKDKEKDKKKEKKDIDDHYSSSGRGNHGRRSTDRDSNDGSSSSKGTHQNNSKTESKKEKSGTSKSDNTSISGDSTSPSDKEVILDNSKMSQCKPVVRVDNLEVPIANPPRLPFVPDVTLKKPKFAANLEEAKKLMKMRKFLDEEQKRMNQEAALLLEFQANVRPSLSQVYSSIPGPELEFACVTVPQETCFEPTEAVKDQIQIKKDENIVKDIQNIEEEDSQIIEDQSIINEDNTTQDQIVIKEDEIINDVKDVETKNIEEPTVNVDISENNEVKIENNQEIVEQNTTDTSIIEDTQETDSTKTYDENKPFSQLMDEIKQYSKASERKIDDIDQNIETKEVDQELDDETRQSIEKEELIRQLESPVDEKPLLIDEKSQINEKQTNKENESELNESIANKYFEVTIITEELSESEEIKEDTEIKQEINQNNIENNKTENIQESTSESEFQYFAEHEKYNAELKRHEYGTFLKNYIQNVSQTKKMYLINCNTYEEGIIKEIAKNFGEYEVINYYKNGYVKLPTAKNVVNVKLSEEITLPIEKPVEKLEPLFSPVKSDCSFELCSEYDSKLDDINKKSRQEVMEIILGNIVDASPSKMPKIDYYSEDSESGNSLKRPMEVESSVNNNRAVLTPKKIRRLSESDQISSTTEENEESSNNNKVTTTRSKYLGKARRVGLPKPKRCNLSNSPSSDKSVENYAQNSPLPTPNGKIKTTPRTKVQRYDTSDLYKPKLHYLSRRNNIS